MTRVSLSLATVVSGCADDAPTTDDATSGAADCPTSRHEGPFELPDGYVGEPYAVNVFGYSTIGGVGISVEGEIPMGMEVREGDLSGVLEESGEFELVFSSQMHWLPPGCPDPGPSTATFLLVVVDPGGGSTSEASASTGA